jgi:hypothetical protein
MENEAEEGAKCRIIVWTVFDMTRENCVTILLRARKFCKHEIVVVTIVINRQMLWV